MTDWTGRITRQGPCALCGHPYAYHRTAETQMGQIIAGDPLDLVADDYGITGPDMVAGWAALLDLLDPTTDDEETA